MLLGAGYVLDYKLQPTSSSSIFSISSEGAEVTAKGSRFVVPIPVNKGAGV